MTEADIMRIVQDVIITRIIYSTLYLCLSSREDDEINIIIQKCYKQALGVPQ